MWEYVDIILQPGLLLIHLLRHHITWENTLPAWVFVQFVTGWRSQVKISRAGLQWGMVEHNIAKGRSPSQIIVFR